ncbi:DUF3365 domain-containing protein [Telmatocola sphagniphila]|uniref:histidine kinase n=1 Tax=Telmatocola sphagniphila TaxID=1123043 RepID=A0A8E6BA17_9BACT|nr:ATP-binding protein [Telmatocola sphagniphila]QVL34516.1 DUF3365 domain-containing protein [Telmatocola sphagniphila]
MSYRTLKNLLGENNLERKCRILFGVSTLCLITFSFWIFARQTEELAFNQTEQTAKVLVPLILTSYHTDQNKKGAMLDLQSRFEDQWQDKYRKYKFRLIKPNARLAEHKAEGLEVPLLADYVANPEKQEIFSRSTNSDILTYIAPIRASNSCIACHNEIEKKHNGQEIADNDLMALLKIQFDTEGIEDSVHSNRAMLITIALVTSLILMGGSYVIIRYVIVKPLRHLKEVSDAITEGKTNVRAEIQTGDEFEDLSIAFNRMLRKLMEARDKANDLNASLDKKVDDLARANLLLVESDRSKSDFLATISHELRTPLNSILGFSDVLLSNTGSLNEKQARWIANIKSNGQQLLNLINDILDLAKIEAGRMEIRSDDISLTELCENQIAMVRSLSERKRIDLRTRYDSVVPLIKQDSVKLRQILSNLLSNAVKFSPEGGRVILSVEVKDEKLILAVTDNGIGIAPADQEVIFEKFRQSGSILTREHEGSGLGLSIVREMCKLLGGTVTLKSELGRGSAFTITLPTTVRDGSRYDFVLPNADSHAKSKSISRETV